MKEKSKFDLSKVPGEVIFLFDKYTMELIDRGWTRYSARAILHRIRWHKHVEKGDRTFKCNNNWTPHLARWFMDRRPMHAGFFETRKPPHTAHSLEDYRPIV